MNQQELKNIGESLAYTAKCLFKTADILKVQYKVLLGISIFVSLISIAYDMNPYLAKFLGIVSVFASVWLLIVENSQHKVIQYMSLGNEYLNLYGEVERCYHNSLSLTDDIYERRATLNEKTKEISISWLAKKWVDKVIKEEMNLQWVYSNTPI